FSRDWSSDVCSSDLSGRLVEAELPLLGLFSVSQDFRKQNALRLSRQEQQLRHSEQQFRELVESMQGVSWELDVASMQFTYMGPRSEERRVGQARRLG